MRDSGARDAGDEVSDGRIMEIVACRRRFRLKRARRALDHQIGRRRGQRDEGGVEKLRSDKSVGVAVEQQLADRRMAARSSLVKRRPSVVVSQIYQSL